MDIYSLGWKGKKVKHNDGRTGVISGEFLVLWYCELDIKIDGGGKSSVTLNARGSDSGETGWNWLGGLGGEQKWLPLGDHNPPIRCIG